MQTLIKNRKEHKEKIGIIGAGVMGIEITKTIVSFGFDVILMDKEPKALNLAIQKIKEELKNHNIFRENNLIKNIKTTTNLIDLRVADIVLETITEDVQLKKKLFKKINETLSQKIIIATNTSSLSINNLSSSILCPERFIGMHFFNPVSRMRLVEVIPGKETTKLVVKKVINFLKKIDKTPIITKDSPGFIVNRMLMPYLNEAAWQAYNGTATIKDIDLAAKLGLNSSIGPFALMDLIGLDNIAKIMKNFYKSTNDSKYLPCPLLEELIKKGKLGKKTKEGFYKY